MWNSENSEPLFGLYSLVVYSEQPKETFKHMNMSDEDRISPYNIERKSSRQVMRINECFNSGIISSTNTKFSKLIWEAVKGELLNKWDLGVNQELRVKHSNWTESILF